MSKTVMAIYLSVIARLFFVSVKNRLEYDPYDILEK